MKKFIKSLLLSLCFVFSATPLMAAMPFADVKTADWFYDEVQFVYENNLFQGTSATTFEPQTGMTRAMFVTVLGRMEKVDISNYNESIFSDVVPGSWYAPYVQWAHEEGITNGVSDTEFGINQPVTREQMATFMIRYLDYLMVIPDEVAPLYFFNDDENISDFAWYSVSLCQQYGLITGKPNNIFDPKAGSTRAEVATVFMRLYRAVNGERIILNYSGTKVPTYDSVTGDFCFMSGDLKSDYFEFGYLPNVDVYVYFYNANSYAEYRQYLSSIGFKLELSEKVDGGDVFYFTSNDERVVIATTEIEGEKMLMIALDINGIF